MSSYPVNALAMPLSLEQSTASGDITESGDIIQARYILNRLFQDYPVAFAVRLWNGSMLTIGDGAPAFTFCLEQASVLRDMVWFSNPKRLVEAYCSGEVQIQGDFHAAMQLREHFESLSLPLHEKLGLVFRALTLANNQQALPEHTAHTPHSPTQSQSASVPSSHGIALSYDVPEDFYQRWLGEQMLHSCAYFASPTHTLAQAQQTQLTLICQKLHLQHGDTLLDIACGWGTLACWAAKHYGVFVHGITHNPTQYAYALKQVQQQGLTHLVKIELANYRTLPALGSYDKAACISIADHLGAAHYPDFLAKVHAALKPGGLFLSHVITAENPAGQQDASTAFINRQLYPAGELTSFAHLLQHMDSARFDVFNVEGLRRHYVMTLRQWLANLEAQHALIAASMGERTYRIWRLAMTASAIQFEQGVTGMHQMLATRR